MFVPPSLNGVRVKRVVTAGGVARDGVRVRTRKRYTVDPVREKKWNEEERPRVGKTVVLQRV